MMQTKKQKNLFLKIDIELISFRQYFTNCIFNLDQFAKN